MLLSLSIQNIVTIESVRIEFSNNLSVITGETGAGKSIIMSSLSFLLGEKSGSSMLRNNTEKGVVIAEFLCNNERRSLLEEYDIEIAPEETMIIKRVIISSGTTKSYINDQPVSIKIIKMISAGLIEVLSQHLQYTLLSNGNYTTMLDTYGLIKKEKLYDLYTQLIISEKKVKQQEKLYKESQKEKDYLEYVYNELLELKLENGEEDKLSIERKEAIQYEDTIKVMSKAEDSIEKGILSTIYQTQKLISKKDKLNPVYEVLEKAYEVAQEANTILRTEQRLLVCRDYNLEHIEERLFIIREIARKYKVPPSELNNYMQKTKDKLEAIDNNCSALEQSKNEYQVARDLYLDEAMKVSDKRRIIAEAMEKSLLVELKQLKMQNTRFKVQIIRKMEGIYTKEGIDEILFIASMNPGMEMNELHTIASGGELSRFTLAIKIILVQTNTVESIIFDEIDTGVSGEVAYIIGKKLSLLSQDIQVIVITHQPQVSSIGKSHFKIQKTQTSTNTYTTVCELTPGERRLEIARMLSGKNVMKEAEIIAEELINS